MKKKEINPIRTRVTTVTCPCCDDEIYSRAHHDFRRCGCGDVFADGGFEYVRFGFAKDMPKKRIRHVKASKTELFDDWNNHGDKFGTIKAKL